MGRLIGWLGHWVQLHVTLMSDLSRPGAVPPAQESTLLLVTMAPLRRPDRHIRVVTVELCDITSVADTKHGAMACR